MANIIPTETATGNAPKILNTLAGNTVTGGGASIGTLRSFGDKGSSGLQFQDGQSSVATLVNANTSGQNGRRGNGGLGNTDLSNAVWGLHVSGNAWNRINMNTKANNGFMIGLSSDTNYNNWKRWSVGGRDTKLGQDLARHLIVIDTTAPHQQQGGTFVNTSVDQFSFTTDTTGGYSGNYSWWFCSMGFRVFKTRNGACGVYGSDANFKSFADACITESWVIVETAKDAYSIYAPMKIGNGASATTITETNLTFTIPTPDKDGGDARLHFADDSVPIFADPAAGSSPTIESFTFNCGIPSLFDLDTNVGATWTWNKLTVNGCGVFNVGADHTITNSNITLSGTNRFSLKGGLIQDTVINGDVTMNNAVDLTNVTINGTLRISTGTANQTLNFSNVSANNVINTNGTAIITINATNGSSLPTTDGGTGAGKVNVINTRTLTLTNLINPTKVYLVDTSLAETDLNFELDAQLVTTGTYTYSFSAGSNINALYRLINLDSKVIEQDVILENDNITIPISQNIDREYENN